MSECVDCGSTDNVVEHHIMYEPEKTVMLCKSCHWYAHNDSDSEYYPEQDLPEGFQREYEGVCMIEIESDVRDRLRARKEGNETYSEVIERLLENNE